MWEEGQLGDSSPRTLIFSAWYYFTKCFGLPGRNEHRQLLLGDVVLKKDPVNGREFLEYSERMTKTQDGTGKENRKVKPRLYGNGTERDPLELYKIYLERRPEKAMNPVSSFYLTCIPWTQIDSGIWYFPRPMGQNTLGNLMPMAAEECGMDRKTNHKLQLNHLEKLVSQETRSNMLQDTKVRPLLKCMMTDFLMMNNVIILMC